MAFFLWEWEWEGVGEVKFWDGARYWVVTP